jgi:glycosyltransferase involved in cell wall biosynthesis
MNRIESSSSRNLVLVNQDSGYMTIDLANALAKRYDKVVLMTGYLVNMGTALDERIKVHHIYKYHRKSIRTRAISWIFGTIQAFFSILFKYRKFDLYITSNPPILPLTLRFIRRPYSLMIWDIYPDALVMSGLMGPRNPVIRIWSRMNKLILNRACSIVTLTEGMASGLEKYTERKRITIIPAWASEQKERIYSDGENPFLKKFQLEGKFIIVYSGNLGKEHRVESLVLLAERLKNSEDIQVMIIGRGWKFDLIKNEIQTRELNNCMVLPKQPSDLFLASLSATDIGVVSLSNSLTNVSIPSKTYNILASGKPILCIGEKNSDLAKLLEKTRTGAAFLPDDIEGITEFIMKLKNQKELYLEYSENAQKTSSDFTSKNADIIAELHWSRSKVRL